MNEQLQNTFASFITDVMNKMNAGADFVVAQLPDAIQQLLIWKFWYHLLIMALPTTLLIIFIQFFVRPLLRDFIDCGEVTEALAARIVLLIFSSAILLTWVAFAINLTWLQILIAPKIYLIEYAAHIMGGK